MISKPHYKTHEHNIYILILDSYINNRPIKKYIKKIKQSEQIQRGTQTQSDRACPEMRTTGIHGTDPSNKEIYNIFFYAHFIMT